jgi:DNA-binding PadR family transcriptional regulator
MARRLLTGASIVPIILSILSEGDSYGYAIIDRVRTLSDGEVEWVAGSLYPVLHRMRADRLIDDYWGEGEERRRRRYYRITAKGHAVLEREKKDWLTVHGVLARLWGLPPVPAATN